MVILTISRNNILTIISDDFLQPQRNITVISDASTITVTRLYSTTSPHRLIT